MTQNTASDVLDWWRLNSQSTGIWHSPRTGMTATVHECGYFQRSDGAVSTRIRCDGSKLLFIGTSTNHPLAFETNATERMRIDSSGTLILKSANKLQLNRSDNARSMKIFNDNSFGTIQTTNDPILLDGQSYIRFETGFCEKMRIDSSGNVGINVTPTQKLHVGGNAIITGITRIGNGTESSPAYQFVDDTNTGMYRSSSDVLGFSTGGGNRLTLNSTGATFNLAQ